MKRQRNKKIELKEEKNCWELKVKNKMLEQMKWLREELCFQILSQV